MLAWCHHQRKRTFHFPPHHIYYLPTNALWYHPRLIYPHILLLQYFTMFYFFFINWTFWLLKVILNSVLDFELPILFTLISSSVYCELIPSKSLMLPTMSLTCIYPLAISPNQLCLQNVSLLKIIWAFKPKTDFLRFMKIMFKPLQRDQYSMNRVGTST